LKALKSFLPTPRLFCEVNPCCWSYCEKGGYWVYWCWSEAEAWVILVLRVQPKAAWMMQALQRKRKRLVGFENSTKRSKSVTANM